MLEGPHIEDVGENFLEGKGWACYQETEEFPEPLEGFMSAIVSLVCSKDLRAYVILVQINGALEDEPEEVGNEDIAGQIVSAVEADEHLIPVLHGCFEGLQKAFEPIFYRVPH